MKNKSTQHPEIIVAENEGFAFEWKLKEDVAHLRNKCEPVWQGPLLPSLWLQGEEGLPCYFPAQFVGSIQWQDEMHATISFLYGDVARGIIELELGERTLAWKNWKLEWVNEPLPIISLLVGAKRLDAEARRIVPNLEKPYWPHWHAEGYCVPGGRTAPIKSFFRRWDAGQTHLALGNFAPSMGAPYGAAFPRPILTAGFGGAEGWLVAGAVEAPDGAMSLRTQSACACFEFLLREELWGAPTGLQQREWPNFLKLVWEEKAVDAFARFYYPTSAETQPAPEQLSSWNSWGEFREGVFDLEQVAACARVAGAELLVYDDPWEEMNSNGLPNKVLFPDFERQVEQALASGLKIGFWQSVGWIDEPERVGLSKEDLLCGVDGEPRLCSWSFDPLEQSPRHYALDPSSPRSRAFLRERTQRLLRTFPVTLLKVDFWYGLPGPDVAAPRDPQWRGERMGLKLVEIIAEAAREVQPDITILGYSLHPLIGKHCNLISLDDLGDAAGQEAEGHCQWSFWSVVAGRGGLALNASSGYDWNAEKDILLNTAILGAPGGISPLSLKDGTKIGPEQFRQRRALGRWYRRTRGWQPLWLNTFLGDPETDPILRCWGRLERVDNSDRLTALALRTTATDGVEVPDWPSLKWQGNWVLISQDEQGLSKTSRLACIPLDGTGGLCFDEDKAPARVAQVVESEKGDIEEACKYSKYQEGCLEFRLDDEAERLLGFVVYR